MTFNFAPTGRRMSTMSAVSPFTYRDGATFQQILRELETTLNEVIEWTQNVSEVLASVDSISRNAATKAELAKAITDMTRDMEILRIALTDLISDATNTGTAIDPVDGKLKGVNDALGNLYDNVRVFARFASEDDMTVSQLESLDQSARQIDLAPTATLNDH